MTCPVASVLRQYLYKLPSTYRSKQLKYRLKSDRFGKNPLSEKLNWTSNGRFTRLRHTMRVSEIAVFAVN